MSAMFLPLVAMAMGVSTCVFTVSSHMTKVLMRCALCGVRVWAWVTRSALLIVRACVCIRACVWGFLCATRVFTGFSHTLCLIVCTCEHGGNVWASGW